MILTINLIFFRSFARLSDAVSVLEEVQFCVWNLVDYIKQDLIFIGGTVFEIKP